MLRRAILPFFLLVCFAGGASAHTMRLPKARPSGPPPKAVCFAWADSGGVYLGAPGWVNDWVRKNAKKYHHVKFSEKPVKGADNYLVVLSSRANVLHGFQPVAQIVTQESDTDFSGNGTATGGGEVWLYHFSGTATTTTTTMVQKDVPYTIEERTVYAVAFSSTGVMVSQRSESARSQTGGNPDQALFFNLGSLVHRIHMKSRLLSGVMKDVIGTE